LSPPKENTLTYQTTAFLKLPKHSLRSAMLASCVAVAGLGFAFDAQAGPVSYITINPPNSVNTQIVGINDKGEIAGGYSDGVGNRGFIRATDGTITTFDPSAVGATTISGLSSKGAVAGTYNTNSTPQVGFVRERNGNILAPYTFPSSPGTTATGVNASNVVIGVYDGSDYHGHGYVAAGGPNGGYVSFDPPGSIATTPICINDAGVIAGDWEDTNQVIHAFVMTADGTITEWDPPGSVLTFVQGINETGSITGYYADNGQSPAYIRAPDGTFTTFVVKGTNGTSSVSINSKGDVTGAYANGSNTHSYVRTANGKIDSTKIDYPGAANTVPTGINTKDAVVGAYSGSGDGITDGFLRTK
jgi:hypothetical protein